MLARPNQLQWTGQSGHFEAYYLTLTDRASGLGFWIRYTLLARVNSSAQPRTCGLWFLAMDPVRREATAALSTFRSNHSRVRVTRSSRSVHEAWLSDRGMGANVLPDVEWNLSWTPSSRHNEHVDPLLRRARLARTVLVLPHADLH
jgi:hypothetical protein